MYSGLLPSAPAPPPPRFVRNNFGEPPRTAWLSVEDAARLPLEGVLPVIERGGLGVKDAVMVLGRHSRGRVGRVSLAEAAWAMAALQALIGSGELEEKERDKDKHNDWGGSAGEDEEEEGSDDEEQQQECGEGEDDGRGGGLKEARDAMLAFAKVLADALHEQHSHAVSLGGEGEAVLSAVAIARVLEPACVREELGALMGEVMDELLRVPVEDVPPGAVESVACSMCNLQEMGLVRDEEACAAVLDRLVLALEHQAGAGAPALGGAQVAEVARAHAALGRMGGGVSGRLAR